MRFIYRYTFLILMGLMFSSLLSGCAESSKDDEPSKPEQPTYEVGEPVEVSVSLSSRSMISSGTRADGVPAEPDDPNEKINDWFLVFVHRSGKVSKIVTRSATLKGTAVEQETFKCIIPTGTYSVYAFANITPAELTKASGLTFTEGSTLDPDIQKNIQKVAWRDELNLWNIKDKAIPMTGYLSSVKIQNKVEESFSIEVVRMLAKVDFLIYNNTTSPIELVRVGLDPVTKTSVSLFPTGKTGISYSHLGREAYTPLDNAEYDRLMFAPETKLIIPKNTPLATTSKENAMRCRFYFKESLSLRKNGGLFTVWLDVKHNDGERSTLQFNVTNDIKDYINRNDWLVIPVELSKYAVRVDAFFYPPIGGYPAYLSSTDPDGSQVFTFGTQGEFCIVPQVIDKETGEHLSPSLYSFKIVESKDNGGIFKTAPYISETVSSLPNEILGTLDTKQGNATVTIQVTVAATETEPAKTFQRTIHIVRDNTAVPADNNTTD